MRKVITAAFAALVLSNPLNAQVDSVKSVIADSTVASDSTDTTQVVELARCGMTGDEIRLRRAGVAGMFVAGNGILYSYFKRAWWSGEKADHFFFQADWDQDFRDQDKLGHALGGYHLARFGKAFLRSACTSNRCFE